MAQKSGIFDSVGGDRVYRADDFADYFRTIVSTGVSPKAAELAVTSNNDMTVIVSAGRAFINGYYYSNDSNYVLNIDPADALLNRIDRVVLRLDYVNREIKFAILKGAPGSNPAAPALTRNVDTYELCLAEVRIDAGAAAIPQAKITDRRSDAAVCGYMKGVVIYDETEALAQLSSEFIVHKDSIAMHGYPPVINVAASKTLALSDAVSKQNCTNAGAITITIPTNATVAFPVGTEIAFIRKGAGAVTFAAAAGVTLNSSGAKKSIKAQHESCALAKIAADEWQLIGSLSA